MTDLPHYACDDRLRRQEILASGGVFNGIAAIEIVAKPAGDPLVQRVLVVSFLHGVPAGITPGQIRITGGTRVPGTALRVVDLRDAGSQLEITLNQFGDFSEYLLTIAHPALDPVLRSRAFRFKVTCPDPFDCRPTTASAAEPPVEPVIDYRAKDYRSLRRALLEFLRLRVPGYEETNAADLGVVLAELFANAGDQLSYFQDAVAQERFLGTARQRVSVKRHARLVDYSLREALVARTWLRAHVSPATSGPVLVDRGTEVRTAGPPATAVWFATTEPCELFAEQNDLPIHTWKNAPCCLPRGASQLDLLGRRHTLRVGQPLLLQEALGATSAGWVEAAADPAHRQIVYLTAIEFLIDPLLPLDPTTPHSQTVTRVHWSVSDATERELCLEFDASGTRRATLVAGNLLPAIEGRRGAPEETIWAPGEAGPIWPLSTGPLAWVAGEESDEGPRVHSTVTLTVDGEEWQERESFLDSSASARHFVVETLSDGRGAVRFGEQGLGRTPREGAALRATYSVGGGTRGNVGPETLTIMSHWPASVTAVTNPFPGTGGADPEPLADTRRDAPEAFRRRPLRAVTTADYAAAVSDLPGVSAAAAAIRWTGSWWTAEVAIDPAGRGSLPTELVTMVTRRLSVRRQAGYDVEVRAPRYVPLKIDLVLCVARDHFQSLVVQAVYEALSNGRRKDGRRGFFHPDQFTFGQPLYLSRLYAAVMEVTGVHAVHARVFQRLHEVARGELQRGVLEVGAGEVLRLDNDPNFPDLGLLRIQGEGGK